ncbi:Bicyclomycin resistance protein [Rhodobacteraceae bacterium THAF1]|uniref:multidrug effflux MFS transporter n=1 Tax=Palleronia sp. THAF1 TaxID=2587842 RepID=UPI000F3E9D9F|nr:multidrug effflux MFS transporter [Palleronia sp. THAF1]QFU09357.1 Bicyclomycin resistance protein [Palleronia sp. THAF1]VDC26832.1 Bicyclomycin resistance protein [Rhodobacteraceae bacterium THAF1]
MSSLAPSRFLDRTTPPTVATMILLTSLGALAMNLFLPSLPNMTAYFDTEYRIMQIAVAGYLGVTGLLQLIIGPISDKYGRRNTLMGAVAIFVVASIGCVFATTIEVFLAFRLLQGAIVAGMILPRAALRDMYSTDQAASMMGWVTMGMAVAPMLAPALGGVLDGLFGWQANFVTLMALGVAGLWLVWADMGETAAPSTESITQQFGHYPELLTAPRFWGYALTAAFASGAFFAYLGGAPYVGSSVYGMSPERLGIYFGAPAVGYMVGNGLSGRYSNVFGIQRMIMTGTIVTVLGLSAGLLVDLGGMRRPETFFAFMIFVGLGNGLVIPNSMAGMLSVRPRLAGTASGLGGALMVGGGAGLSALAGILLERGEGAAPLLWLMTLTSLASVASIWFTIRREKRLAARGDLEAAE